MGSLIAAAVAFAACSNDVIQISGTGGAGTTTASTTKATTSVGTTVSTGQTTAVTSTTGVTTGVTTSAVSTGVGGAPAQCDAACTKAEGCGFPQGQCQQYLDCNTDQGKCLAMCVNDPNTTCQDFIEAFQNQSGPFYDCSQNCQGTMSTGTGTMTTGTGTMTTGTGTMTSSVSTGTGMVQSCNNCAQNMCGNEINQCFGAGNQACQAWLQCVQNCNDKACTDMCSMAHPAGAPIEQCACTKCSNSCGQICGP